MAPTPGVLGIWHGCVPGTEPALEEWYNRQHHIERIEIPGFLRARRYIALDDGPRFFCRYDVTGPEVLRSDAYLAVLNRPTEWTQRVMPNYRNMSRTVFLRHARLGRGDGAFAATLRLPGGSAGAEDLLARLVAEVMPRVVDAPLVLSAEAWLRDPAMAAAGTAEVRLRGGPDTTAAAAIVVDATSLEALHPAIAPLLAALPGATLGLHALACIVGRD
jgi:hypothetical protein